MVDKLARAERPILAMLNAMTGDQKALVRKRLHAAYLVDDAMTHHHEVREVIKRVTGTPKAAGTRWKATGPARRD